MTDRTNFDHYITQHFIKLFSDKNGIVYSGDIHTQLVESLTDVSRILGKSNWSVDQQVEDIFTRMETKVAKVLKTLKYNPLSITGLSKNTRDALKEFITMHYIRSTGIHDAIADSARQLAKVTTNITPPGFDTSSMKNTQLTREESLGFGISLGIDFEPIYTMKGCVALIAPKSVDFILGDNPFINISSKEFFQFRGAIFDDETYFWFPLNPKIGLFFAKNLGNSISSGSIIHNVISNKLTNVLNRAEVYMAVDKIIGNRKGLVRNKSKLPNIGPERNSVKQFGSSPLVINHNKAVYNIDRRLIDELRTRF